MGFTPPLAQQPDAGLQAHLPAAVRIARAIRTGKLGQPAPGRGAEAAQRPLLPLICASWVRLNEGLVIIGG